MTKWRDLPESIQTMMTSFREEDTEESWAELLSVASTHMEDENGQPAYLDLPYKYALQLASFILAAG